MSRAYSMTKRLEKAYETYVKEYKEKEFSFKMRGLKMASPLLTKGDYLMTRQAFVDAGVKTNINKTIISAQSHKYSAKAARQMKSTFEKYDLRWKDKTITELRQGAVDVSKINDWLKSLSEEKRQEIFSKLPDDVKHTNQGFISWRIYGSK